MKLIILEGGDRLGKSTLIEGICKHLNYDNVTIRHVGKPPKGLSPKEVLWYQFKAFDKEAQIFHKLNSINDSLHTMYYDETVIWNRSHLGEYVYSQMFRGGDPQELKNKLLFFEEHNFRFFSGQIYLITLTAEPEFFHSKEDGHSFSQKLEDKTKELELFKEAHDFSIIKNKLLIKVDHIIELPIGTEILNKGYSTWPIKVNQFRPKQEILNEVLNFIK